MEETGASVDGNPCKEGLVSKTQTLIARKCKQTYSTVVSLLNNTLYRRQLNLLKRTQALDRK